MTSVGQTGIRQGVALAGAVQTPLLRAMAAALVAAVVLLAIGVATANGHVILHAVTAAVIVNGGGLLTWRGPASGPALAPAVGLAILALPILIEAAGALGYDALTQERTGGLAVLHDVGRDRAPRR